jgi:hypothetical protein
MIDEINQIIYAQSPIPEILGFSKNYYSQCNSYNIPKPSILFDVKSQTVGQNMSSKDSKK